MTPTSTFAGLAASRKNVLIALCLVGLVVVGAWLRLMFVLSLPIWLDEAYEWCYAKGPYLNMLQGPCMGSIPSFILAKWSIGVFGGSEFALRLPALLLSLVNIVAIFWLGKRIVGPWVGLLLAALLATDPFFVQIDATARHYPLWLFGTIVLFGTLTRLCRFEGPLDEAPWQDWLLLACALAFAFWTHMLSAFLWLSVAATIGGEAVWRAWRAGSWTTVTRTLTRGVITYGVAALLVAPWLYMVARLVKQVGGGLNDKLPGGVRDPFTAVLRQFTGTSAFAVVFVVAVVGLVVLYRRNPRMSAQLAALIPAGLLALWFVSRSHDATGRYVYPFFLPVYIGIGVLLAEGYQWAVRHRSVIGRVAVLVVCVAMVGWRTTQTVAASKGPVDGRFMGGDLLKYVAAHCAEDDVVVAIPPHLTTVARFYGLYDQCLPGDYGSQRWITSGLGYRPEEIPATGTPAVWILIQVDFNHEPWKAVTEKEIQTILAKALGRTIPAADVARLAEMSIVKVAGGNVTVATFDDVLAVKRGHSDSALTGFVIQEPGSAGEE